MDIRKSMVVARADIRMAMKVGYVKYSVIALSAMGPVIACLSIIGISASVPAGVDKVTLLNMFIPLAAALLTMMSIVPATMIAANALVGEREQNTLEPLLATPLTDIELVVGKMLSSLLPTLAVLFSGTAVSSVVVFSGTLLLSGDPVLFPDPPGLFLIACIGPVVALSVVSVMILISSRVRRVYEAYQTGGAVVMLLIIPLMLPIAGLESPASTDYVWGVNLLTFLLAVLLAVVTWAMALRNFNRDYMISLR